jgi:hypothetical protein
MADLDCSHTADIAPFLMEFGRAAPDEDVLEAEE